MSDVVPIDEEYILDNSVIMSEINLDGIITYVNRKFCEVTGYDRKESKGKHFSFIRHPDMPPWLFEKLWSNIEKGDEWTGVIKSLRKDGKYYWIHSYISPIIKDGKITGYSEARRRATKLEIEEAEEDYGLQ